MPAEPTSKRTFVFVDGQNLFYAVKLAFGYSFPNYDIPRLAQAICMQSGWNLAGIHFYTGIPSAIDNPHWNHFWTAKLAVMGTRGVSTFSRPLKYRNQTVKLADGSKTTVLVGQEKGIDVRMALDIVRLARQGAYDVAYDVAVVLSQEPGSVGGRGRGQADLHRPEALDPARFRLSGQPDLRQPSRYQRNSVGAFRSGLLRPLPRRHQLSQSPWSVKSDPCPAAGDM